MAVAVVAKGLWKSYPSGHANLAVLKGVDLTIQAGEFVSLMGPSGSGKSTLLHLVGLLDRPTSGSLALMGRDVATLSARQAALARRELLGFIFQSFHLMPRLSALHNVMLPMAIAGWGKRERRERAENLLGEVGLAGRHRHRPNELSGGEKQRVAIARALALDPPILLADEPTGNLDSATGAEIMALFGRLHQAGKTVLQVTHDSEVARHANRIVRIRDGQIFQDEAVAPALSRAPASSPVRPVLTVAPPARAPLVRPVSGVADLRSLLDAARRRP
ncbi:MAG: ABC transporter ATP-binding protein [Thermoplasmatota archaeon]